MADEEKIDGARFHGSDWEVVALTASTYAASPGPGGVPQDDSRNKRFHGEHESSSTMFMSDFVFPPHEHENLPLDLESDDEIAYQSDIHCIPPVEEVQSYFNELHDDSPEDNLSISNVEYQEDQKESFFNSKTHCGETVLSVDDNEIDATYDSPNKDNDMSPDFVKFGKISNDKTGGYSLPCETWWKRHAMSLYKQTKETNTFWSICMAAALMGLLVLGQQWQREKLQFQQVKLQFSITNERMSKMMLGSVNRFKDAIIGSHHQSSVIHNSASANL